MNDDWNPNLENNIEYACEISNKLLIERWKVRFESFSMPLVEQQYRKIKIWGFIILLIRNYFSRIDGGMINNFIAQWVIGQHKNLILHES